jgi:hypothetical protein
MAECSKIPRRRASGASRGELASEMEGKVQAGDLATVVVSTLAALLLIVALAAGPGKGMLAPLVFYVLVGAGICEATATELAVQAIGAVGFAAAVAALAAVVLRAGGPSCEEGFRWEEFEAAFRDYVQGLGEGVHANRRRREGGRSSGHDA